MKGNKMIQKHTEETIRLTEIIDDVFCNKCGQRISKPMDKYSEFPSTVWDEYITVSHGFGYFSNIFSDGERHEFHLCEQCYSGIINDFKIPVEIHTTY